MAEAVSAVPGPGATLYRAVRIHVELYGRVFHGAKRDLALLNKFRTVRKNSSGDVDFVCGGGGAFEVVAPNGRLGDVYGGASVSTVRLRSPKWSDDAQNLSVSEAEAFALGCTADDGRERFVLYKTTAAAWSDDGAGPWRINDDSWAATGEPHHRLLVPNSRSPNARMYQAAEPAPSTATSVQNLHSAMSVALNDALHLWEFSGVVLRAAPEPQIYEDDGCMTAIGVIAFALNHVWRYEQSAEVAIRAAEVSDKLSCLCPSTPTEFVLTLGKYERALVVHALLSLDYGAPGVDETFADIAREIAQECEAAVEPPQV